MKYLYKVRWWMKLYSSNLIWKIPTNDNEVFLTFDDGPHPEITPWVLDLLEQYNAKATFFCLGKNVEANPEIFRRIKKEGHEVGNHTYSHEIGWKSSPEKYILSINRCESVFGSIFFRPPHGRISWKQIHVVQRKFKIVMWSLLSGDFEAHLDVPETLDFLKQEIKKGDIIVFHDSEKAYHNLKILLPELLEFLKENNYQCNVVREIKTNFFGF